MKRSEIFLFERISKPGHGVGREFDELVKDNKNLSKLSSLGQKKINRFKRENSMREKIMKTKRGRTFGVSSF